jgi:hypothetical protein
MGGVGGLKCPILHVNEHKKKYVHSLCSVHRQWAHSADKTHKCRIFQLHEFSLQSSKIYLFSISSTSACPLNMSYEQNRCPCHSTYMLLVHALRACPVWCMLRGTSIEHGSSFLACSFLCELTYTYRYFYFYINVAHQREIATKVKCASIKKFIFLLSKSPQYRIVYNFFIRE